MKIRNSIVAGALLTGAALAVAAPAMASSHREAPGTAGQPRVDGTDFYMFRSYEPGRGAFVTLIANYVPIQSPYGGPNYFTLSNDAIYEIHIDTDGDAREDLTYQFNFNTALANGGKGLTFNVAGKNIGIPLRIGGSITNAGDPNINETETYTLTQITGDRRKGKRADVYLAGNPAMKTFAKPIDNIGTKSIPNYAAYANQHIYPISIPNCSTPGKVFVGQRAEGFAVNLGKIFDLVNLVPLQGASNSAYPQYNVSQPFTGGIVQNRANDELVGKANITSLALELPIACVTGNGNGTIGGWTTASLPQAELRDATPGYNGTSKTGGAYVQVSRLSAPLVNEVVIGLKDKDLFNAAKPTQDGALADYVTNPALPVLLDALFRTAVGSSTNIAPSNIPRTDLVAAFLTGFPGFNQQKIVTGSEMMRLNTAVPATPLAQQNVFGVVAEDLAGFPNGRRPIDDTVDIALRVVMGALCHPVPLGAELGVPGAVENTPSDLVNLGYCQPSDAPVGNAAFTDGAPISAADVQNAFPYLNTPLPGSM